MYKRTKEKIHFIGIGGIGMSGIAEILHHLGFPISGSDIADGETVKRLRDLGVQISIGHRAENLADARVVVTSSAVKQDNPEVIEAKKLALPIVPRAEMLAELMRLRYGVAVAGSHGKTTTTSMLGFILANAGTDPTVIVGGKVDVLGGVNAKLGTGQFLIAEADESDGSFLKLSPVLTIITNIDNDHLDYYERMENLRQSFVEFANKVPYYGRVIVSADDEETKKVLPLFTKPVITYGFSESADYKITNYRAAGIGSEFTIKSLAHGEIKVTLNVPGEHNAKNATAAAIAALELDVPSVAITDALRKFTGAKRRFEKKGEVKGITIVDDYGHHPTEVIATIKAARSIWPGRIVVAFQPHRYSRTQLCWDQFKDALKLCDKTFLLDIYAAGEAPIDGIDSKKLSDACNAIYSGGLDSTVAKLTAELKPGDLLITLGAGSITGLGQMVLNKL